MLSHAMLQKFFGILGSAGVAIFVLGLAWGISSGFAGFWGGLPFWIICFSVLSLVFYDLWDSCFRKNRAAQSGSES